MMMTTLSVNLKNCYGIDELKKTLDFTKSKANLIYAPNGVMKTSLARTFLDISNGKEPQEKLFNKLVEYNIKFNDVEVNKNQILVIQPFDQIFESKNISTLLVNTDKKRIYDNAFKEILTSKKKLTTTLNKISKVKVNDIENQICKDFNCSSIFEAIENIVELNLGNDAFGNIDYKQLFDLKVMELVQTDEIQVDIAEYTEKYNELIDKSDLFHKGVFNPTKASTISAALKKENFFKANHKIILNGSTDTLTEHEDFHSFIEAEKEKLLGDGKLKTINEKLIGGAAPVKYFQEILETYPEISSELANIDKLKKIVWSSYYISNKELFDELLNQFNNSKEELKKIELEAGSENTLWQEAVITFKERFHVPFDISIENKINAVLGTKAPNIVFTFTEPETNNKVTFDRGQLNTLDFLSIGERRAMYLLYVIFEFKARAKRKDNTIIVIDDIADSFDYKNKYAIIEYLKEISEEDSFRMIVLTHNFDFYRTFQARVLDTAKWDNSYIAQKFENKIKLIKGGQKTVSNPFDLWKNKYHEIPAILISMIPFVRNLIEYKDGTTCDSYNNLTSMLHIKEDTNDLKIKDLDKIIGGVIKPKALNTDVFGNENLIIDLIYSTADELSNTSCNDEVCLERKVALSIAIRLKAEEFMFTNVKDKSKVKAPQTGKLFDRLIKENTPFTEHFLKIKRVLNQVILITPENIHLNSFMYEPLMDMSDHHLVTLYKSIKTLEW
jgi:hypothetical protein